MQATFIEQVDEKRAQAGLVERGGDEAVSRAAAAAVGEDDHPVVRSGTTRCPGSWAPPASTRISRSNAGGPALRKRGRRAVRAAPLPCVYLAFRPLGGLGQQGDNLGVGGLGELDKADCPTQPTRASRVTNE